MVRTKFLVIFLLVQKKNLPLMPMENEFKNIDLQTCPVNIVLANLLYSFKPMIGKFNCL